MLNMKIPLFQLKKKLNVELPHGSHINLTYSFPQFPLPTTESNKTEGGGGGANEVSPLQKGCVEIVLAMLKGGPQQVLM